jgi:hypothetical protein
MELLPPEAKQIIDPAATKSAQRFCESILKRWFGTFTTLYCFT